MKSLSILGSTGSIGCSTLEIVAAFPDRFAIEALTAYRNVERLAGQVKKFSPRLAVVKGQDQARQLKELIGSGSKVEILAGRAGYLAAATLAEADTLVGAMVGAAGLEPVLAAIDAGKDIALANKETLVMAGELVMNRAADKGVRIVPVDSEHSAIFQCLQGQRFQDLERILLTASGGPFLETPADELATVGPRQALKHPNWSMGPKITIDSATLMNKGLEVIEARWLFGVAPESIEVVVHPQSIVHSMVAFHDGSILAQMGPPDMKTAIAYALSWPERLPLELPRLDFAVLGRLEFRRPDLVKFPCLALALQACRAGGTLPVVMNAANEIGVAAFLDGKVTFDGIARVVERTMELHTPVVAPGLDDILGADDWARGIASQLINEL